MKEAEIIQELSIFDLDDKISDHEDHDDATTTNPVTGTHEQNSTDAELIVDPGELDGVIENDLGMQQTNKSARGNPTQEKFDSNTASETHDTASQQMFVCSNAMLMMDKNSFKHKKPCK